MTGSLPKRPALRLVLALLALTSTLAFVLVSAGSTAVDAHGSVSSPASRVYECRFAPRGSNAACEQAWAANPQALYDWTEVNIPNAAGNHRDLIPDGELCSAGRDKYAAFDAARADWPTTNLAPDGDGLHRVSFVATAPHATEYFRFYVTKADYDITTPLEWADLELVHDSGRMPALADIEFVMALPERPDTAILYQIWQRSDSPEAFYSCSDVTIGRGAPVPPPPIVPPSLSPNADVTLEIEVTDRWDTGYCARGAVKNTSQEWVEWLVELPGSPSVTSLWDGISTTSAGVTTVRGAAWNAILLAGASTTFGFCADGSPTGPTSPPDPQPTTPPTATPEPPPALSALCNGLTVTINMRTGASGVGTAGNDVILGTPDADVIDGRGGNDVICGRGGADRILGGGGADTILGGGGADTILGGSGGDIIYGGDGNDRLFGQRGDDSIRGGEGDDLIVGKKGNDELFGGSGSDTVKGGTGNDSVSGGPGNDPALNGGDGADRLRGDEGNDVLRGNAGNDTVFGGPGADNIKGGLHNDQLHGGDGPDTIYGKQGDDNLFGDGGNDELWGSKGNDSLNGGASTDECRGGPGTNSLAACEGPA